MALAPDYSTEDSKQILGLGNHVTALCKAFAQILTEMNNRCRNTYGSATAVGWSLFIMSSTVILIGWPYLQAMVNRYRVVKWHKRGLITVVSLSFS